MGRLRFEPIVSVGAIIQIGLVVISVLLTWHKMDTAVQVLTQRVQDQERRIVMLEDFYLKTYGTTRH